MKLCIIGSGGIGKKRAIASRALGINDIVFVDNDIKRANNLASEFNGKAAASIEENFDAALICTPHNSLSKIAISCLKKNIPILIEKPGGSSLNEILAIKHNNRKAIPISIGFNHRFHSSFGEIKKYIDEGLLGEILFVRASYGHGGRLGYEKEWRSSKKISGGGQLIDQGAHLIDLCNWLLGPLKLKYAHLPTLYWDMEVEDNCFVALEGEENKFAWLHATWTEWKNNFSFEITGTKMKMQVDGLGGSYGTEKLKIYNLLPELGPPETTIREFPFPDRSWEKELNNFFNALNGTEKLLGDLDDCIKMHQIINDCYKQFGKK